VRVVLSMGYGDDADFCMVGEGLDRVCAKVKVYRHCLANYLMIVRQAVLVG